MNTLENETSPSETWPQHKLAWADLPPEAKSIFLGVLRRIHLAALKKRSDAQAAGE